MSGSDLGTLKGEAFVSQVYRHMEKRRLRTVLDELKAEERQAYSLSRAVESLLTPGRSIGGFEIEIHQELLRSYPDRGHQNGVMVPVWALAQTVQRALTVGGSSAGYLASSGEVRIDSMADALRGTSVIATLPITVITNASGDFGIPREALGPTAYVIDETNPAAPSVPSLGNVLFSPKTAAAVVKYSRKFAKMASGGADAYLERTLRKSLAAKVDQLAIAGSGTEGEPLGLLSQLVGTVTGTSLDEADIREFQEDIGDALGDGCGFVANRAVASLLNGRQHFSGSSTPLWVGNLARGTLGGWPAYSSSHVPADHLVFGQWAYFVLAEFGPALEIMLNPYENFARDGVSLRIMASFDVGILHAAAFTAATAVT